MNPAKTEGNAKKEGKSGAEQRPTSRAPGRPPPSVPYGAAGQKGYFAEPLPEWPRWPGINKRKDSVNAPDAPRGNEATWSNPKTSQTTGESTIQNIRNKVSTFLSPTTVSPPDAILKRHHQLNQVYSIVLFVVKDHVGLALRNNDVNWEGTSMAAYLPTSLKR